VSDGVKIDSPSPIGESPSVTERAMRQRANNPRSLVRRIPRRLIRARLAQAATSTDVNSSL
jgi:hypothetical protein